MRMKKMNYSNDPGMCRVDFFKESGKWYETEAVDFSPYYNEMLIHEAFKKALKDHFGQHIRMVGMRAFCIEPYHMYAHPISLLVEDWNVADEQQELQTR